jgi:hypothetical protein
MRTDDYRKTLRSLKDWEPFLLKNSGLPGPRGNIELGQAVADQGDERLFRRLISFDAKVAPTNTPQEFLAFCGTIGFGRLAAEGDAGAIKVLRKQASDPRWRTREAVAMGLQRVGDKAMARLLREMDGWSTGNLLEQRAAVAALCEPRLLKDKEQVLRVLRILEVVTRSVSKTADRKSEEFQALKKGLGYCWSVAVAARPENGKTIMEKWFGSEDCDIRWIMKENLKKDRLRRADAAWVKKWSAKLS